MTIFISYGLERSGSTLAFETTKYLLEGFGYSQKKVNHYLLEPLKKQENYIPRDLFNNLDLLCELNKDCELTVFKTHAKLKKETVNFIKANNIPLSISIRDPRDIIISLLEIGKKIRDSGEIGVFNYIYNFDLARKHFRDNFESFKTWIPLLDDKKGSLVIFENFINDSEPLLSYVSNLLQNEKPQHSLVRRDCEKRFTQFNKGISGRGSLLLKKNEIMQLMEEMNFLNEIIKKYSDSSIMYKPLYEQSLKSKFERFFLTRLNPFNRINF